MFMTTILSNPRSYLKGILVPVFSNEVENDLQPVGVQVLLLLPLVQTEDPPASVLVPGILPVREDSLLEERVVSSGRQTAGHLDVVVERPEVLHRGHCDDGALVLLPGPGFVILEEPEGPGILKGMFDTFLGVSQACLGLGVEFHPVDLTHQIPHAGGALWLGEVDQRVAGGGRNQAGQGGS